MKEKKKKELGEDATKYGEFVCSTYHWLSPEKQKKQAKRLENMTNKDNKKERKS